MNAVKIVAQGAGGKRTRLADVLPLEAPFVLQIFPAYVCNFRCNFCIFSVEEKKRGFISDKKLMDFEMYKRSIDEMTRFKNKIKVLRFAGMGEPLLHPQITEMIAYATEKQVAEKTEIITNASLLDHETSDRLAAAGLSRLLLSIEGVTPEKYQKISQAKMDFDKFLENIRYCFEHRGKMHIHAKIVNIALDGPEEEEKFYQMFDQISDSMGIENVMPLYPCVDFKEVLKGQDLSMTQYGVPVSKVTVCPQPFYTTQINPDGKVVPCYSIVYPEIMGDCTNESIYEIWHGEKFRKFRLKMLEGSKISCEACRKCEVMEHRLFPEDDLSGEAERLKKVYQNKMIE